MLQSKMLKTKIDVDNEVFEEELFAAILELKHREKQLSFVEAAKDTCNSIDIYKIIGPLDNV